MFSFWAYWGNQSNNSIHRNRSCNVNVTDSGIFGLVHSWFSITKVWWALNKWLCRPIQCCLFLISCTACNLLLVSLVLRKHVMSKQNSFGRLKVSKSLSLKTHWSLSAIFDKLNCMLIYHFPSKEITTWRVIRYDCEMSMADKEYGKLMGWERVYEGAHSYYQKNPLWKWSLERSRDHSEWSLSEIFLTKTSLGTSDEK